MLRQRGLLDELSTAATTPPFIKLVTPPAAPRGSTIDVVLTKRRRLRVRPGLDADTFRALVRLLEDESW